MAGTVLVDDTQADGMDTRCRERRRDRSARLVAELAISIEIPELGLDRVVAADGGGRCEGDLLTGAGTTWRPCEGDARRRGGGEGACDRDRDQAKPDTESTERGSALGEGARSIESRTERQTAAPSDTASVHGFHRMASSAIEARIAPVRMTGRGSSRRSRALLCESLQRVRNPVGCSLHTREVAGSKPVAPTSQLQPKYRSGLTPDQGTKIPCTANSSSSELLRDAVRARSQTRGSARSR